MPRSEAERLLTENRAWLEKKMRWARSIEVEATALGLSSPGLVWISGLPMPAPALPASSAPGTALERWYRRQARTVLTADTERLWTELHRRRLVNRRFGRISIRDQSSRWGSCSAQGNLSYSWRLLMMPAEVREYVVLHELCHLAVLNHSPKFWALLNSANPDWNRAVTWLRRYGPLIVLHSPLPGPAPGQLPPPLPGPQ